jgi:hypothetical protein
MVDLSKNTGWACDELLIPTDTLPMVTLYQVEANLLKFWTPEVTTPMI